MSRKLSRKFRFSENEKVLCYQGPLIYEAKCLQFETRGHDKHYYFVHYSGWNKHWDEWVNESRVLKHNATNLVKQKEVLKKFGALKNKRFKLARAQRNAKEKELQKFKASKSSESNVNSNKISIADNLEKVKSFGTSAGNKSSEAELVTASDIQIANNAAVSSSASKQPVPQTLSTAAEVSLHIVNIIIPNELQALIADDWDFVSRQKLLFHLPAKVTVHKILKKYLDELTSLSNNPSNVKQMILGLQEYFNVMLGSQLLYKFERPQYGEMLTKYPGLNPSQIYGAFHFLRFFVQLETILPKQKDISEKNMKLVLFYIHDCLQFLKNHKDKFFKVNEYETAPAEYHRRAMT